MKKTCSGSCWDHEIKNGFHTNNIDKAFHFTNNDSEEALLFLQDKLKRLEKQDYHLLSLLTSFKENVGECAQLRCDLQAKTSEIAKLQLSVSNSQVYLIREREENLRLSAENDMLRIRDLESNRAIDVLLQLSDLTKEQLRNIISTQTQKNGVTNKKQNEYVNAGTGDWEEELSREGLLLQIRSLKTQLSNLKTLSRSEVDVLLKDREILAEERVVITENLQEEIDKLSKQLFATQKELFETAEILLYEHKEKKNETAAYINKPFSGENQLNTGNRLFDGDFPAFVISGAGTEKVKRIYSQRQQSHSARDENMVVLYQQQAKKFEAEAKAWKEKAAAAETFLKSKIQKLSSDLSLARNRYEDLDRRRILEGEGFRTDIKMLREKLKDLEKKLNKIQLENAGVVSSQDNVRVSTRTTFKNAKQLEKELALLKIQVAAITDPFS